MRNLLNAAKAVVEELDKPGSEWHDLKGAIAELETATLKHGNESRSLPENTAKDGGPAFPRDGMEISGGSWIEPKDGMTLRDYFAASALGGMHASCLPHDQSTDEHLARWAYKSADAMIAEREKKEDA